MSELASLKPAIDQSRRGRPVTAYLKPSDYCNVGCTHCYLPLAVRSDRTRMTEETLDLAIDCVRDMVDRQRAPGALVVWHGGEPLALPIDWMTSACAHVARRMPDAVQSIQTSLIPYRSAWGELAQAYFEGEIGSSIDFSQRAIRGDVKRYQDLWLSKVDLARRDGCSIIPGIVPSRGELGRGAEISDWMHEHGFEAWNIDRYNSAGGPDPARPSNQEHSQFLSEVFDRTMERAASGTFVRINTVRAALSGVMTNSPGDRWGGSCSHDFIVVNPDGSTNACPDKISFETFSNVKDGMDGFEASDARRKWIREHLTGHRNPDCPTCPFRSFCRSGCPLTPNAPASEGECSGYHRHLSHVADFARRAPILAHRYLEETLP